MSTEMNADQPAASAPDFDALCAAAVATGTPGAQGAGPGSPTNAKAMGELWKAVFALPKWYFIGALVPEGNPGAGTKVPFCASAQGKPMSLAFTDAARATKLAGESNVPQVQGQGLMEMTPEEAVRWHLAAAEKGLWGVGFNSGTSGFFAPIADLVPMFVAAKKLDLRETARQFGADEIELLARRAAQTKFHAHFKELMDAAYALEHWFFIDDKESPGRPVCRTIKDGSFAFMGFTDHSHAIKAAKAFNLADTDGNVRVMAMTVPDAVGYFEKTGTTVPLCVFNAAGAAFPIKASEARQYLKQK